MKDLQNIVEEAWDDRTLLASKKHIDAILKVIDELDLGRVRVSEKVDGIWKVNDWIKKAVILYFPIQKMKTIEIGPLEFHDKIPLKSNYASKGVRVVPLAIARYGSFLEEGTILMPSYINIGAYVGSGTMVDTWATVGSCAQIVVLLFDKMFSICSKFFE